MANLLKKQSLHAIIFLLLAATVLSYGIDFVDDYTYEGTTTDDISWTTDYTMNYQLGSCGGVTPWIIKYRRSSGALLLTTCQTKNVSLCLGVSGVGGLDCVGNDVGAANQCDTPYSTNLGQLNNYSGRIYADYWVISGGSCVRDLTTYYRYYQTSTKYHVCQTNQSGMFVMGSSSEYGASSPTYTYNMSTHPCPAGTYCSKTLEYESVTSATQDLTATRCAACGTTQQNFTNHCLTPKTFVTLFKWSTPGCGSTTYAINSSIYTCNSTNLCDYSQKTSETTLAALTSPCFTAPDDTTTIITDTWDNTMTVESSDTDYVLMNKTNISITVDEGIAYSYPAEVTCITNTTKNHFYTYTQINGELLYLYTGVWNDLDADPTKKFKLSRYDLATQTAYFDANIDGTLCKDFPVSIYDTDNPASITFVCNTFDLETDLFALDTDPFYISTCYAENAATMLSCIQASQNYSSSLSKNNLYQISNLYPEKLRNNTAAYAALILNLSERNVAYNLTAKYYSHCNENTTTNYELYGNDTHERLAEIWSTNTPQYLVSAYRSLACVNTSTTKILANSYNNATQQQIGTTTQCLTGYQCTENTSIKNYDLFGLMNASNLCKYIPTCFDGIKDGGETLTDYGGECGTCFDKILNGNETPKKFHPYDYGGYYCGNCTTTNKTQDIVWITALTMNKREVPFDAQYCIESQNGIFMIIIFFIIAAVIMIAVIAVVNTVLFGSIWGIALFIIKRLRKKREEQKKREENTKNKYSTTE